MTVGGLSVCLSVFLSIDTLPVGTACFSALSLLFSIVLLLSISTSLATFYDTSALCYKSDFRTYPTSYSLICVVESTELILNLKLYNVLTLLIQFERYIMQLSIFNQI